MKGYFKRSEVVQPARESRMTAEYEQNYAELILTLNRIREDWGKPLIINSGFRPDDTGRHGRCNAVDIRDFTGDFYKWLIKYLDKYGISVEDRRYTPTYVHLDREKRGGIWKVFIPY